MMCKKSSCAFWRATGAKSVATPEKRCRHCMKIQSYCSCSWTSWEKITVGRAEETALRFNKQHNKNKLLFPIAIGSILLRTLLAAELCLLVMLVCVLGMSRGVPELRLWFILQIIELRYGKCLGVHLFCRHDARHCCRPLYTATNKKIKSLNIHLIDEVLACPRLYIATPLLPQCGF